MLLNRLLAIAEKVCIPFMPHRSCKNTAFQNIAQRIISKECPYKYHPEQRQNACKRHLFVGEHDQSVPVHGHLETERTNCERSISATSKAVSMSHNMLVIIMV